MYPQAASAIEQVAVFVHAAERQPAVIDADPPTDWALDTADHRAEVKGALGRLHLYPPQARPMAVTDEGPALLYELAGIVAQMIDPDALPPGHEEGRNDGYVRSLNPRVVGSSELAGPLGRWREGAVCVSE
jgi:hypothetical protein